MDKSEAEDLLARELAEWRSRSYMDLASHIGKEPTTKEVVGSNGTKYQVEVQVFWDSKPKGELRVLGAIDDGGWRALSPLSDDFILSPDGSFVGE
jgi:hypothetical protein